MHPEPSDGERLVGETARKFLEATVPLARRRPGGLPAPGARRDHWKAACAIGVTSLLVPEEFGGSGIDDPLRCLAVVAEEFGRVVAPGPLLPSNVVAGALVRAGSPEQRAELLPGICSGDVMAAWAVGHTLATLHGGGPCRATATPAGYRLDGVVSPVESGADCDVVLVTAAAGDGPVQLLVPVAAPGLTTVPLAALDLDRPFAELVFDGVEVGADRRVGDTGAPGPAADVAFQVDLALSVQAAETAAMADAVLAGTIDYLVDRYAFGRPVASYQAIKHRLADHRVWLEGSLGVATALARALDTGDPGASRLASTAKVHVAEHAVRTVSDCSQLLGGISMTWEHNHHRFLRRVTANRSLYGSPADHRERLCRLAGL